MAEGRKDDVDKEPWHLLPWDAVLCIVKVLRFGARKYEERNWEKGMAWSRCFAACQRHLTAWFHGENCDAETGYSHLWHAGCCVLFLIAFERRKIGVDDRPLIPKEEGSELVVWESQGCATDFWRVPAQTACGPRAPSAF